MTMLDQDAVTGRVVAKLDGEGRKLLDLSADEIDAQIEAAFAELIAETRPELAHLVPKVTK